MKTHIKIPIQILTQKIAPNKTDSIFYAGKDIAEIKIGYTSYILTTAGEYAFYLKHDSGTSGLYNIDSNGKSYGKKPSVLIKLTDAIISRIGRDDLVMNWGWFTVVIRSQMDNEYIHTEEVYSSYNEAIDSFIAFVEKDLAQ
jgi:hypothetical protein